MDTDLGGVQARVAQPLPEHVGTDAPLGLVRRKRVAERMRADLLGDAGGLQVLDEHLLHPTRGEPLTLVVEKEGVREILRTDSEVTPDRLDAPFLQLNRPGLHPFAGSNLEHAPLEINILTGQVAQLADANSGLQEDLQDRVVAGIGAGEGQELGVFIGAEGTSAIVFLLRRSNAKSRVRCHQAFAFEEPEELSDGGKLPGAGLSAHALLAQVGEVLRNIAAADVGRRDDRSVGLGQAAGEL